jgi:lysophospholipase L1-like esterase
MDPAFAGRMKVWTLVLVAAAAAGCATAADPVPATPSYLALGDSVAFGFSPLVDLKLQQVTGYPEVLAARRGLEVTNLACPGEASGGFASPTGADNHCRENRQAYPLHVSYEGTQLQAAIEQLRNSPNTQLVTIDLGANDVFLLDHLCGRDLACILSNFVTTMHDYNRNLDYILTQLRAVYDGPLVALTIYNPYPADRTAQYALEKIDEALAEKIVAYGGVVADGLTEFAAASNGDPCKAGLLIALPDGTCDVHPTPAGAQVLADAIDAALTLR